MKKCQSTFNYIFSAHSLILLQELRLLATPLNEKETSGYIAQNICLSTLKVPDFCIQFRELINEEEFLLSSNSSAIETLSPAFTENINLIASENRTPATPYKLVGLLLEETPAMREQSTQWEFPCEIFWYSPESGDLFHQLSYKKKFPFWAIVLESNNFPSISDTGSTNINETQFQNKKALWVHLETTSWDFLILKSENGPTEQGIL